MAAGNLERLPSDRNRKIPKETLLWAPHFGGLKKIESQ